MLHSHLLLHTWHRERLKCGADQQILPVQDDSHMQAIVSIMNSSMQGLWDHCEGVINRCLDEYLHFAPKRSLFERSENGTNDSLWKEDLQNLHEVLLLTDRFFTIRYSFLNVEPPVASHLAFLRDGSHELVWEKLSSISRRHLRSLHVEAMNSVGRRLANESWVLGSFNQETVRQCSPECSLKCFLLEVLETTMNNLTRCEPEPRFVGYQEGSSDLAIARFAKFENPFDVQAVPSVSPLRNSLDQAQTKEQSSEHKLPESAVYDTLRVFLSESQGLGQLAPEVVTADLLVWFCRLLLTIRKLPLVVQEVSAVFVNLCDLYFTTVFRLCAGKGHSELLLLGVHEPKQLPLQQSDVLPLHVSDENVSGSPGFFSFRTKGIRQNSRIGSRPRVVLPCHLEAEICSPLHRESQQVALLREYVVKAQESLQDVVSLDMVDTWLEDPCQNSPEEQACEIAQLLGKREGAIWSALVVVALVDAASTVATIQLGQGFTSPMTNIDSELAHLELAHLKAYCRTVLAVIPTLTQIARSISCNRAMGGAQVVEGIIKVGSGWEESKLHEHSNDYVEDLCDRCSLIWGFLSISTTLPTAALKITWEHLVSTSYMSILDGFSRVPVCSTEGRALMALDLASFASGISPGSVAERLEHAVELANRPPQIEPLFDMRYVDTYIKVFYYPKDDVMNWIAENYPNYKLNHVLALVVAASRGMHEEQQQHQQGSNHDSSALTDFAEQVKRKYVGANASGSE